MVSRNEPLCLDLVYLYVAEPMATHASTGGANLERRCAILLGPEMLINSENASTDRLDSVGQPDRGSPVQPDDCTIFLQRLHAFQDDKLLSSMTAAFEALGQFQPSNRER